MRFSIHGPFKLLKYGKTIDHRNEAKKIFWKEVDQNEALSTGCGCYLFAMRAGRGVTPWYVGKAEKQKFYSEVFGSHKLTIYGSVIANQKGTPLIFLIAKRSSSKNKLSKPTKNKNGDAFINDLEILLMGAALKKNKKLSNIKNSVTIRNLIVPGFINSTHGANHGSVRAFIGALTR